MKGKLARILQRQRLAYRRRFYWGRRDEYGRPEALEGRDLGIALDTPKPCSCVSHGCGNPRRDGERSWQEARADEQMRLDLEDLGLHPHTNNGSWKPR